MKKELHVFFSALMFYTRIPCPSWVVHSSENLENSTRYFTLIGLLVGGMAAIVFYGAHLVLPDSIAILLSMLTSILTTGAFHEDGLADVCDGFGGGWTTDKILEIMKDSRIGTYGVVGLVSVLLLKFTLSLELTHLSINYFLITLVLGHILSRFNAMLVIFMFEYARNDASSKTKPLAKRLSIFNLILGSILVFISMFWISYQFSLLLVLMLVPLLITAWYSGQYFKKWIGGYTGDCLGAVQQISEILVYGLMLGAWKFI